MKQGDKVLVFAEIDACRTGLQKKEYRVRINDITMWVDEDKLAQIGMEKVNE
jgi:hypothetical protein